MGRYRVGTGPNGFVGRYTFLSDPEWIRPHVCGMFSKINDLVFRYVSFKIELLPAERWAPG